MEPNEYATLFAHEDSFWWYRSLHRLVAEELTEHFRRDDAAPLLADPSLPPRTRNLLDAGCGTAGLLPRVARWGRWHGLDWSPHALAFARRREVALLTRGSVERLPYRDDAFDAIVSLDVLYHREVQSDLAALQEFRRCLRPGGCVVLNLPAYESLRSSHDEAIHSARRYRREPLRALLCEAGLRPRRLTHWNAALLPGLALLRLWRRRAGQDASAPPASDVRPLPGAANALLEGLLSFERAWLRRADLPFGLSILAVAERPASAGELR